MICFFSTFDPPRITAQEKGVMCMRVGRKYVPKFFDIDDMKVAKKRLCEAVMPHRPATPMDGPLCVRILWVWPWIGKHGARVRKNGNLVLCDTLPDFDNLSKNLLDVMSKPKYHPRPFIRDDARIAHSEFLKCYGSTPGIGVEITHANQIPESFYTLCMHMDLSPTKIT